ncbi:hypothetical protein NIES4071_103650 (plasmid) [Calothrix sp. NIES-4071]|nr:hypothetical protein NIES4071_103650 [Calothrix sp. NIES-4071]BAZ64352.1 hypothetical protein NIES4105_100850 [Calothrix sp. NIES-4105]
MAIVDTTGMGKYNLLPFKVRKAKAFWYALKALICEALQAKQGVKWQGPDRFKEVEAEMKTEYGEPGSTTEEQTEIILTYAEEQFGINPLDLVIKNEEVNAERQQYMNR